MAKKLAIPENNREFPEYEYRKFPLYVGGDQYGNALIAKNAEEVADLEKQKVYPLELGKDKNGNPVILNHPSEKKVKASMVVVAAAKESAPSKFDKK